jgi:hypothetical protein
MEEGTQEIHRWIAGSKSKVEEICRSNNDDYDDAIVYLGVTTPFLRPMSAVEAQPMCVDHNYSSKEVFLLCIAEEANLHNVEVANVRSCNKRVYYDGMGGAQFKVRARPTLYKGWTVKEYDRWLPPTIPPIGSTQPGDETRAMRMTPRRIVMEKKMKNKMVVMISLEKRGGRKYHQKEETPTPIPHQEQVACATYQRDNCGAP